MRMMRILSREGADLKVLGHFFKVVVQAVLLFGAKTWVLTPRMEQALRRFQNRFAQRITGRQPRQRGGLGLIISSTGGRNGGSGLRGDQVLRHEEV